MILFMLFVLFNLYQLSTPGFIPEVNDSTMCFAGVRESILSCWHKKIKITTEVLSTIKNLGIHRPPRGSRGGLRKQHPITYVQSNSSYYTGARHNQVITHTPYLPQCFPSREVRSTARDKKAGQRFDRPIHTIVGHRPPITKLSTVSSNRAASQSAAVNQHNLVLLTNSGKSDCKTKTKASKLSICTLNPWSVCNKTTSLHDFIIDQSLDLFALTETWLTGTDNDNVVISALLPKGYSIKHNPRKSRGGGTALIHRTTLTVTALPDTSHEHKSFETLECIVKASVVVRLIVVYRPPPSMTNKTTHQQFLIEFADYLEQLVTCPGKLLLFGDFNYHMDACDDRDRDASSFRDLITSFGLKQHVTGSTHKSGHTLDLVLSRADDSLVLSTCSADHGFPDHFPVMTQLTLEKPQLPKQEVTYRKVKDITTDGLTAAIKASGLCSTEISGMPLHMLTGLYDTELKKIMDLLAPVKTRTITVRPEAEWYNTTIRVAKQERRQAERLWRKTGLTVHRDMYMDRRSTVNSLIEQAKTTHYRTAIAENQNDTKQLFSIITTLLGKKKTTTLPADKPPSDLCSIFGNYFIEKIDNIRKNIPVHHDDVKHGKISDIPPVTTSIRAFRPVSTDEIKKIVASMASKSCDLDPMQTSLVKKAIQPLGPVITGIVNKSLTSGVFPSCYKEARVTPLIKKPSLDPEILKNYRPVSNLNFVSKVIEKVVASELDTYLKDNNLLEPCQSAYRKGHSTETALVRVQNDIIHAVGQRKAVLLVLLDLSAAFDTVSHPLLLNTLQELGIGGTMLQWFTSYLADREQRIQIGATTSEPKLLNCGVPQGSVLGPIMFTIYTASLGRLLRKLGIPYHLYADDTQLWIVADPRDLKNAILQMEKCATAVKHWMEKHHLRMNDDKTEFLVISAKSVSLPNEMPLLNIGGHDIIPSSSARNIGVIMNSRATMESHVLSVSKSCYIHLRNISKIRKFLDRSSLERVVHAFITTKLDYCNSLLCGAPTSLTNKLQRIQNIAARIITGHGNREHITPVLKSLHWLPVEQRIKFKTLILVYKAVNNQAPAYLQELLHVHTPSRELRSSNSNLLSVPFTRSSVIQECAFSVAGPRLWNCLPFNLRCASSLPIFKAKLKTHLFLEYYD